MAFRRQGSACRWRISLHKSRRRQHRQGQLGFSYNDANRLTSVSASGQPLASYVYNARGERVQKTLGGNTRHFHYDFQGNPLGEFESGAVLRAYVYVDVIRRSLRHNHILGDERFREEVERMTGRRLGRAGPGRPSKAPAKRNSDCRQRSLLSSGRS